jgi:GTP cyclohydrolase I
MIDKKAIEKHIRGILIALGENPNREGLINTPKRVAEMYSEVFEGINYTNDEIASMFNVTFEDDLTINNNSKDMVFMKNIGLMSYCEHHIALMYNMKVAVAYIPNNKVIGLSKIARVVDMVGKRLQLQERIGSDIAEIIQNIAETKDVAVIIEGEHGCMTARGIKKPGTKTLTTTLRGSFKNNDALYNQLLTLYRT